MLAASSSSSSPPLDLPDRARRYPMLRFMGSKHRLLPWLHSVLATLDFETALDAFSGSGCVAYLLKTMEKRVIANDSLSFAAEIARAAVENSARTLDARDVAMLVDASRPRARFIEETFGGVFFTRDDLCFLDRVRTNVDRLRDPRARALAIAALVRSCLKRQPRGVFTVAGDPERYKDGRRDLAISLEEHFHEQVAAWNACVFDNARANRATRGDVFDADARGVDLVYMDPPYVPRADDNCYVKRYHFVEGLSCYWRGVEILRHSKVKKIKKPFTPFSYRRTAEAAFARMFERFRRSTLVLSYGSNAFPDLEALVALMERVKRRVEVHATDHRYHFGTHAAVKRASAREYLIVGRS